MALDGMGRLRGVIPHGVHMMEYFPRRTSANIRKSAHSEKIGYVKVAGLFQTCYNILVIVAY